MKKLKCALAAMALLAIPTAYGAGAENPETRTVKRPARTIKTGAGVRSLIFSNPDNHEFIGARAGLNFTSVANGGAAYSSEVGFEGGLIYHKPVVMNLYLEPGVMIFSNPFGTSHWDYIEKPYLDQDNKPTENTYKIWYQVQGSVRNIGLRIPLMLGYHFDISEDTQIHIFGGPQANVNFTATYQGDFFGGPSDKLEEEMAKNGSLFRKDGGFKRFDLQWRLGAGVTYGHIFASLSGSWGFSTLKSSTPSLPNDIRRNLFALTAGYNF